MNYKIEKLEDSKIKFVIDVDATEWESAMQDAYQRNKGKYNLAGFRKGHAPRKALETAYGKGLFIDDALDIVLPKYYGEVLDKESDVEPMCRPTPNVSKLDDSGVTLEITVTVRPEVKLGQYKGLTIEKKTAEVTDEEVQSELELARDRASRVSEAPEGSVAAMGNTVTIDFVGTVNGEVFQGGSGNDYDLELGSGSFIPGFEEQLVGAKVGDVINVQVTFPTEYVEDLAGKAAEFKTTIKKISVKEMPELDDEFAKDASEFDTLDEYKADIKAKLLEEAEKRVLKENEDKLFETIVENAEVVIPSEMVAERKEEMVEEFAHRLSHQGLNIDQYFEYTGSTKEQLAENYTEPATSSVKTRLVFEEIIKTENLAPTAEAIEEKIKYYAESMNEDAEKFKARLTHEQIDYLANEVLNETLLDFLKSNNA